MDQLSIKKKSGKIASIGISTEKNVKHIFNEWHDEVMRTDKVPEVAIQSIAKGIAEQVQHMKVATYHTYIHSFEYSLEQHIKSFDVYRKNLAKIAEKKYNIELALLIEIHMEFKNLYLNNKDGTSKRSFGQYPILGDIIQMLEQGIDKRKVDYIVLCLGDTLYNDYIKVIAFHTSTELRKFQ